MKSLTPARLTLIMFIVVGALIAAYVAKGLFAKEEKPPEVALRSVPAAVSDMQPGTRITEAHLGVIRIPEDQLQPGSLINDRSIIGRVVREKITAAAPILTTQLYEPGEFPPLQVEEGMVAVSVQMENDTDMVDGLIKPGEYVNVHMTVDSTGSLDTTDDRLRGGLTLTLFRGAKVLAINQNTTAGAADDLTGNRVTLELTREQANILILAKERGHITLTFAPEGKGSGVVGVSDADRATLEEILGLKPIPEPEAPFSTETFRGTGRTVLQFRDGGRVEEDNIINDLNIKYQPKAPGNNRQPAARPARQNTTPATPRQPSA